MNPHEELWAKQKGLAKPYPLLAHLLDSAAVAGALWDHWLRQDLRQMFIEELGSNAREIIQFVVGSHDIGKATRYFNIKKRKKVKYGTAFAMLSIEQDAIKNHYRVHIL
ncbi:hypothetical protein FRC0546_02097 [Corynebacterium diphtheriae]|nr:hypothetical protein FRC0546_02097 [Corynebacterium diphtheriae]